MGRGLARREYAGFGIPMDESRDRFDEAARMVLDALETGFIEGDGPYFPQPRTAIRPRARAQRSATGPTASRCRPTRCWPPPTSGRAW